MLKLHEALDVHELGGARGSGARAEGGFPG